MTRFPLYLAAGLLVGVLAVAASCAPGEPGEVPESGLPDLLICDYQQGLFRFLVEENQLELIPCEDPAFLHPTRLCPLSDGTFLVIATGSRGEAEPVAPALFAFDPDTLGIEKLLELDGLHTPTDAVELGPGLLLLSERYIHPPDMSQNWSAVHRIDLEAGTREQVLKSGELLALSFLRYVPQEGALYMLDADSNPDGLELYEGALFRYSLDRGELELIRAFRETYSPFQLVPYGEAFLLLDVNSQRPPGANWNGELLLYDPELEELRSLFTDPLHFLDPVRGFLHGQRFIVAESNSDPLGTPPQESTFSYGGYAGYGAIYAIDLESGTLETVVASEQFRDPLDVQPLPE